MNSKKFAPIVAMALLLSVAAPAFAGTGDEELSVGVSQTDGVVVTVTSNETAVENASVSVEALNNTSYAGTGSYTTDANGTVSLPTPANNTTIRVVATKGNVSDATTATLVAPEEEETGGESFGQQVSAFVHALISGGEVKHPGRIISAWVTQNNPGADEKPNHAGPPETDDKKGDDNPENGHDKKGNDESDDENDEDEKKDHPGEGHGKKNGRGNGR